MPALSDHPCQFWLITQTKRTLITAAGLPLIYMSQREIDRKWKNRAIVLQFLMRPLYQHFRKNSVHGGAIPGSPKLVEASSWKEAWSVLACGWTLRLWAWWMMENKSDKRVNRVFFCKQQWGCALPCSWVWVVSYGAGASLRNILVDAPIKGGFSYYYVNNFKLWLFVFKYKTPAWSQDAHI